MFVIIEFNYTKDTNSKPEETTRVVWASADVELTHKILESLATNINRYYWIQEINV